MWVLICRDNEKRAWPNDGGGIAIYKLDGVFEPVLAVRRQPLGEHEVRPGPVVLRPSGGSRPLRQSGRLPQFILSAGQEQAGPGDPLGDVRVGGVAEPGQQVAPGPPVLVLLLEEQTQLG